MKSLAILEPNKLGLVEIPKPKPGPYDVVVKNEAVYFCNATDRKLIEGHFPGVDKFPMLLGHEAVGIVEEVGAKVTSFKPNDRVVGGLLLEPTDKKYESAWGGMSEYVVSRDHCAMVNDGVADEAHGWNEIYQISKAVPKNISPEDAGMINTWREVYASFDDFNLKPEYKILIYGAGPVGLSFLLFAKARNFAFVGCVEPQKEKHGLLKRMGADAIFTPDDDIPSAFRKAAGSSADAIIDAVGSVKIINSAIPLIKMGGSVCVYGVISDKTIPLEKHLGPYNFNLLIHQWPTRAGEAAAYKPLCDMILAGKLSHKEFLTGVFALDDYENAYAATKKAGSIKTMFKF